ncbi:hypothetical protein [Reinekea sp.]|uniref:hypothetical protein n=1 Tax=Reinekea sp. TaxID=1970455 RepID=UPI0025805BF0|nr:hypothetical protein [Reinekea sp.]
MDSTDSLAKFDADPKATCERDRHSGSFVTTMKSGITNFIYGRLSATVAALSQTRDGTTERRMRRGHRQLAFVKPLSTLAIRDTYAELSPCEEEKHP